MERVCRPLFRHLVLHQPEAAAFAVRRWLEALCRGFVPRVRGHDNVPSIFDKTLITLHERVKKNVMDDLRSFREERLPVGYSGVFLDAQLDITTVAGEENITFTVSDVRKGSSDVTRVMLATRTFPGSHTAEDIRPWIESVRRFCCFTVYLLLDCFEF